MLRTWARATRSGSAVSTLLPERLVSHDAAGQSDRTAVVQVMLAGQGQHHLPHQLPVQAAA